MKVRCQSHISLIGVQQETPDPPEALNCIPSLQLADIPKEIAAVPTDIGNEHVRQQLHAVWTSHLVYSTCSSRCAQQLRVCWRMPVC